MDVVASHSLGYGFFLLKTAGYFWYRPYTVTPPPMSTVVVVPVYNEDLCDFQKCLICLERQTITPSKVIIVDDGSKSPDCYEWAIEFVRNKENWQVWRLSKNSGKRAIHRSVLRAFYADIFANVDSDTQLEPNALEEALKPFAEPTVQGVCGTMSAYNRDDNFVTRYLNYVLLSQDYDRAALSAIDSIIAPGRFHLFRRSVFERYGADYFEEKFLGRKIRSGDDATLSRLATRNGHVVYQSTCHAQTRVASNVGHFVRQCIRWERNTIRMMIKSLFELKIHRPVWWINVWDMMVRINFGVFLIAGFMFEPVWTFRLFMGFYFTFLIVMLRTRPAILMSEIPLLAAVPFLKMMQLIVLWPFRIYAAATCRCDRWGTR